ncbi:MAG: rhomboid family intramembrane serine protease [Sorangiineae bacterium PRO1]|nr:rhomboid family intramembrane serine protease [Sorangiineae bacterium PRO1]
MDGPDRRLARRMTARTKRTGPLTREELDAAALRYLDRFDSSAKNLRRVLLGYVKRVSAERGADAAAQGGEWVDELLARYQRSGLVDDARFAGAIASGLRRRGSSGRAIVQNMFLIIAINLVFGLSVAFIDNWGHMGGLFGGAVLAWALLPRYRPPQTVRLGPQPIEEEPRTVQEIGWVVLGLAGLWFAVQAVTNARLTPF